MMNVKLNENILTVVTPIKKETADKAFSALTLTNEDGDILCTVSKATGSEGKISSMGLVCNTVVDGKLAVIITMPMGTTMDNVKQQYGKALVNVGKYIDQVAATAEAEIAAINGIFGENAQ